jgi:hypothetical protein
MHLELPWLQSDIMHIGMMQVSLAHGAIVLRSEPQRDTFLAELMSADGENTNGEC